jgi:serine/threonine protein kinase
MTWNVVNLRSLGKGGNGDLYLGQRTDTGAWVVVKCLRAYTVPLARRAFAREVGILGRGVRHVVMVLFADLNGPRPYYIMPYLSGGSLAQHAGRLADAQLRTVARQLARALHTLHSSWVYHGDVKPDNVLLAQDGDLQLADPLGNGLGCTILLSDHCGGTPGYWAPEVRAGGAISAAGDVYSLGATLFHLLTGIRPSDGQRLDREVRLRSGTDKVCEIIAAACHPSPAARPSMADILRLLRGERWSAIAAQRQYARQALTVGGLVLGGLVLANGALG